MTVSAMSALPALSANGFSNVALSGSLPLALLVAALAGLVSFLSPCVLPLVPGYLGYVTGLTGVDLERQARGRMLAGAGLFVLGFTAVFVTVTAAFGGLGGALREHQVGLTRVLGVVTVVLGLVFLGVAPRLLPQLQREWHPRWRPAAGLAGAPLLGAVFGLAWVPCTSATLSAVVLLATEQGTAGRGAVLAVAYCLGLGLPFLVTAVAFRRVSGAWTALRRHQRGLQVAGGVLLVGIGVLLATGLWTSLVTGLQTHIAGFEVAV